MSSLRETIVFALCLIFFDLLEIVGRRVFDEFVVLEQDDEPITAVIVSRERGAASRDPVMMTRWHSLS